MTLRHFAVALRKNRVMRGVSDRARTRALAPALALALAVTFALALELIFVFVFEDPRVFEDHQGFEIRERALSR